MLCIYEALVLIRLPIMICIFTCGKRMWRAIKRISCCSCLRLIESEQSIDFEIYDAQDYVRKINQ